MKQQIWLLFDNFIIDVKKIFHHKILKHYFLYLSDFSNIFCIFQLAGDEMMQ